MAVPRRGRTVRRPARVPDPAVVLEVQLGVEVLLRHLIGELIDLADLANHDRLELTGARAVVQCDAGAVIPAVLQPTQTVQKLFHHHALLRGGAVVAVREDATHRDVCCLGVLLGRRGGRRMRLGRSDGRARSAGRARIREPRVDVRGRVGIRAGFVSKRAHVCGPCSSRVCRPRVYRHAGRRPRKADSRTDPRLAR